MSGCLKDVVEIAVKRLAKRSHQGVKEFKSEVSLIAKPQHRNLVRLLGCCVEHHEKVLVYEYLPNKGLDSFIFDGEKCSQLNWEKRYNIILGIAKGMVYLHQDSRLRIINRDLKTSNVLLDNELNPKISDFGMPRIFKGNQIEANTYRVVGTIVYMSPEYSMEGLYSIKSDVFSFGVILLRIINRRKNTSYHQEKTINLISDVTKENNTFDFNDLLDGSEEVSLVIAILLMVFWFIMVKRREERKIKERQILLTPANGSSIQPSTTGKQPLEDFSFFKLSTIVAATNNFSVSNKLGQGGFGTVYKGRLRNGIDIAVKRLAKNSDQGFEEFKNEVSLIVKLQHRNLVRLLGCCFQPHEKMLIYEYLPNKGLDSFIFDQDKCYILNWEKRFNIILGIARGMIYLHQDSRLKIIHRDLKASNILLDDGLNPKISDFGTARIFGGDQMEANTKRVVGTYGYMSPEYAMEGLYSIKSDVFSFGVILLEIINGRKNTSYHQENTINLIGHAWALWNKGKVFDIIDSRMGDLWPNQEVLKCIHIGLLCVQEHAMDRPTMSEVVFMLCKDMSLPSPKQPAFIFNGQDMHASDSLTNIKVNSINSLN
ncbi:G-type lectin S-receptor-like serine/threonine-protein kinase At1g11410 [Impatiens glandulifera]|uniref:G-type lectin S-receptor-like serine/threonine-protein kinase At1g11410 n=1 Tax=Impatiens glandulifera TaxID=253017 RepID=UPI001FB19C88|nr:G-type lectin S-receptor-like serine/threonine-protein kinase At1g11410 [Impatiens glandulifera]